MRSLSIALVAVLATGGCIPAGSDDSSSGRPDGGRHVSCRILRPSVPDVRDGPRPDGANFYQFTSRVEGEVLCDAKVRHIVVTVVFHHSTNGHAGSVTGRTTTCNDAPECSSFADY